MLRAKRSAYELSQSQVTTPHEVVSFFWKIVNQRRKKLGNVLDLGAGDCRFACGNYKRYVGVEIDSSRIPKTVNRKNVKIIEGCAFKHKHVDYDACIGNPPYVRHHEIEEPWKGKTASALESELKIVLNRHSNLYLYFLCLALLKTKQNGLISLLIPYEWVSRPSAKSIRKYITDNGWDVAIYRFQTSIFPGVLTTASISIIDKNSKNGIWDYFDIKKDYTIINRSGITGSGQKALPYENRGKVFALRGLSPGTQDIFTLSEGERIHHGIALSDVTPCVTTLRAFPRGISSITKASFKKYFVNAGARCWLINSHKKKLSATLRAYLGGIPIEKRSTYTCQSQTPWYNYLPHPIPKLLVSSGFTKYGPKVLQNKVGVCAVGSVMGIHAKGRVAQKRLQNFILSINFEKKLVGHAKILKKIEVKQMNSILNLFIRKFRND